MRLVSFLHFCLDFILLSLRSSPSFPSPIFHLHRHLLRPPAPHPLQLFPSLLSPLPPSLLPFTVDRWWRGLRDRGLPCWLAVIGASSVTIRYPIKIVTSDIVTSSPSPLFPVVSITLLPGLASPCTVDFGLGVNLDKMHSLRRQSEIEMKIFYPRGRGFAAFGFDS